MISGRKKNSVIASDRRERGNLCLSRQTIANGKVLTVNLSMRLLRRPVLVGLLAMTIGMLSLWWMGSVTWAQSAEEVETEVDMDAARFVDQPGKAAATIGHLPAAEENNPEAFELKEDSLIKTSRTLRRLIEQNKQLQTERDDLDERLRNLRGQRSIEMNRTNSIIVERDAYKQQNRTMAGITQRNEDEIRELKEQMQKKDEDLQATAKAMAEEMAKQMVAEAPSRQVIPGLPAFPPANSVAGAKKETASSQALAPNAAGSTEPMATVLDAQAKSLEVLDMVDELSARSSKLKADQARVHYNMGNIYYRQSDYQRAVREYHRAIVLMPKDQNAHFNLAFVSGEYLHDYATALKHYKEYLDLNPGADDAGLVQEKILDAELQLKANTHSSLENDLKKQAREVEVYVQ